MKLKELYTKAKAWCIKTVSEARSIKQKLSHDNLFDLFIGTILAFIGLYWYLNDANMSKLIIIALPALVSWFNELVNVWQGAKFGWKDLGFRMIIGILLYLII
jgi:hypothetical protein